MQNNPQTQCDNISNDDSNDIVKEDQELMNADKQLKKLIKDGKIMILEYKNLSFDDKNNSKVPLFELVNTWNPALGFSGYRSGVGFSIYPLHFPPDDYYMFQQMAISCNKGEEVLEYNIFFTKDFGNIDTERFCFKIYGVFGVNILPENLKSAILSCFENIDNVTQENQFDYELYNEDNITIKVVAMEDVTGEKYIVICSRYKP